MDDHRNSNEPYNTGRDATMSRQPTSNGAAYAWHSAAVAGKKPAITSEPQCGWFKRQLRKDGPYVGARIFMEQPMDRETGELIGDEVMRCEVDGKRRVPEEEWLWLAGDPITLEDFLALSAPSFLPPEQVRPRHLPF